MNKSTNELDRQVIAHALLEVKELFDCQAVIVIPIMHDTDNEQILSPVFWEGIDQESVDEILHQLGKIARQHRRERRKQIACESSLTPTFRSQQHPVA